MNRKYLRKCAPLSGTFGLIALGIALPARATNLLINPGFESPAAGGTEQPTATGWTFLAGAERATFQKHSGSWSDWQRDFEPAGGVTQTIGSIVPGTAYSLSAFQYFEANTPTSGETVDFKLTWEDSSGSPIGNPSALFIPTVSATTQIWTQYTLSTSNFSTSDGVSPSDGLVFSSPIAPAGASQVVVSFDYFGPGASGPLLSSYVDDADFEGLGVAPTTATWALAGSGDWNISGDWSTGNVPNAPGQEADFFAAIGANSNVYTDIAVTAGTLNFNNINTYVIDGAGSLTLQAVTGNAQVIVQAGTQEINLPLTIASNTVFNVSSGATLIIGNPMTIDAGKSVTSSGSGTVTYNSIINVGAGASIAFANSTHANALNLISGASASIATHSGSTPTILQLDNLSNAGLIDVTNNDMIVHNGNLATITSEIGQGFTGKWHGTTGITSSTAAAANNKALGVELATTSTFEGQSVTVGKDVLVKYTYYGDSNLDGQVNATDYTAIDNGFNMHSTGWVNGDFNYDGVVNGDDYTLIDNAFNTQGGIVIAGAPAMSLASNTDQIAGASSAAVPEPATFSMLGLAAAGLILRRRRSQK